MNKLKALYQNIEMMESLGLPVDDDIINQVHTKEAELIEKQIKEELDAVLNKYIGKMQSSFTFEISYSAKEGLTTTCKVNIPKRTKIILPKKETVTNTPSEPRIKAKGKTIKVTFPNGEIVTDAKAVNVLAECIKRIGWKRVHDLNINWLGDNLVLDREHNNPQYHDRQVEIVPGVYVTSCSNTKTKVRQLEMISKRLNLGLDVEIVEK